MKAQNGREVKFSTEHPASSYGIPVLLIDGVPHAASYKPTIKWVHADGFVDHISSIGLAASCLLPEELELYEIFKSSRVRTMADRMDA